MNIEWKRRAEFAEIAEVIGISTELIFAARPYSERIFVLYTPDYPEDPTIWVNYLKRDSFGVLQLDSVAKPQPGLYERLMEGLDG